MAVLIDLHVRPLWSDGGALDAELLAVQARDHGLDGVVVVGDDAVVALGDTQEVLHSIGVQLFTAVALQTDNGKLLCYPRGDDAWYTEAGWQALAQPDAAEGARYAARAVVQAFVERGGAVVAIPGVNGWTPEPGVCALMVLQGGETALHEVATRDAHRARVAGVGGSGCAPGEAAFGAAATLLATPAAGQDGLVEALRSSRVWPAQIGFVPDQRNQHADQRSQNSDQRSQSSDQRQPPRGADPQGPAAERGPRPERPAYGQERDRQQAHGDRPVAVDRSGQSERPAPAPRTKPKADPLERPGDNRGNRLNREEVLRALWQPPSSDDNQPMLDPVALMYGVENRKQQRRRDLPDVELDRSFNGNRARGADPNVMAMPAFEEMRNDRQTLQILFAPAEEQNDLSESVALRFALSQVKRNGDGSPMMQHHDRHGHKPARGQQRRRR